MCRSQQPAKVPPTVHIVNYPGAAKVPSVPLQAQWTIKGAKKKGSVYTLVDQ